MLKRICFAGAGVAALAIALLGYNVARHLVFWSSSEDVVFDSGAARLAGTLIKPGDSGVFPAVVVLHGAGPDTRGGAGYRVAAKALVRSGFAVLIYDKRGTGGSTGDFGTALYRDFIADAIAAVDFLASRADIDGDRIGLNGNSESGWFTPEIAATTDQVAFIINKAGPPLSWIETVIWEIRNDLLAADAAEADLEPLLALIRRKMDYLRVAAADPARAVGPERDALETAIAEFRVAVPRGSEYLDPLPAYDSAEYRKFANYGYDPAPYLRELDIPMLYVFGELDVNVPPLQSVAFLESLRATHEKDIVIRVLPGVGHALYTWRGPLEFMYPPGYLDFIGSWAARQVGLD